MYEEYLKKTKHKELVKEIAELDLWLNDHINLPSTPMLRRTMALREEKRVELVKREEK
jgi:hypothetical protein